MISFVTSAKSFMGHLTGTGKSLHTVKSYSSDLVTFDEFLKTGLGQKVVALDQLTLTDLARYHDYLVAKGLKTNTRRRKLLTAKKFLNYLSKRKKIGLDPEQKIPAPLKLERLNSIIPHDKILTALETLPRDTIIEKRNRVFLRLLLETGILVSEAVRIDQTDFEKKSTKVGEGTLLVRGKNERTLPISLTLANEIEALIELSRKSFAQTWLFLGFNQHTALGSHLSERGAELLVKHFSNTFSIEGLTPRALRHSAVLKWFHSGQTKDEIRKNLGLKTDYSMKLYEPYFKSMSGTTSSAQTSLSES